MTKHFASINDVAIAEAERKFRWEREAQRKAKVRR